MYSNKIKFDFIIPTTFRKRGFSLIYCAAFVFFFFFNKNVFFYVQYSLIPLPFLFLRLYTFPGEQNRTFQLHFHYDVYLPIKSLFYVFVTLSHKQHNRVVSCWRVYTEYSSPDEMHFVLTIFIIINIVSHWHNNIFSTNDIFMNFFHPFKMYIKLYITSVNKFHLLRSLLYYWLSTELGTNEAVRTSNSTRHSNNMIHFNCIPISYWLSLCYKKTNHYLQPFTVYSLISITIFK